MAAAASPTKTDDAAAVVVAARDYFEGWFDGDVTRMDRALHPDFVKRRAGEELGLTTKGRMLELTREGQGKEDAADRRIASATVRTAVYHEYLQLVRTSDGWRIANALWQPT